MDRISSSSSSSGSRSSAIYQFLSRDEAVLGICDAYIEPRNFKYLTFRIEPCLLKDAGKGDWAAIRAGQEFSASPRQYPDLEPR